MCVYQILWSPLYGPLVSVGPRSIKPVIACDAQLLSHKSTVMTL